MSMLKNQKGPGTIVGANVKLQGTLRDTSDIIVHGHVDGEVVSEESVVVEENASIKGPVTARVVTLSGTIKGAVDAKEKLEIMASGKLNGSLITSNLIIHSGAKFNGKSSMLEKDSKQLAEDKDELPTTTKADEEMFSGLDVEIE